MLIKTGLAIELPAGTYGRIAPRSSLAIRGIETGAGVVDRDFRGEVKVLLRNWSDDDLRVYKGDRVAQLVVERILEVGVNHVGDLSETQRGNRGFGYSAHEEAYPWAEPDDPLYQRQEQSGGSDLNEDDEGEIKSRDDHNGIGWADIGSGQHWVESWEPWLEASWHDQSSWTTEDWSEHDSWSWPEQFAAWSSSEPPAENTATAEDDQDMQEALEAEKAAEALMTEARRTWSQAQQATANLRRDRGFGQFQSSGKGSTVKCHICSGPHFARDCPDRQHPQYRKGSGKFMSPVELDAYLFKGKGKGPRKGKDSMFSQWDDFSWPQSSSFSPDAMLFQKGKSKGYNTKGGKLRSTVNVYGLDFGMLELQPLELYATNEPSVTRAIPPGFGMLDCGATASAGPEASVKKLISVLWEKDVNLQVSLDQTKRPFFRYGSGRWGQALYHASISPSNDTTKVFEVYALPNPDEYYKNDNSFKDYMLVPILVGMDFLMKVGLILDFQDGHAVFGKSPSMEPFSMPRNIKGHFMVDIVQYLFDGSSTAQAASTTFEAAAHMQVGDLDHEWFELGVHTMSSEAVLQEHAHESSHSCTSLSPGFSLLLNRRRSLNESLRLAAVGSSGIELTAASSNGAQVDQGLQDRRSLGSRASPGVRSQRSPFGDIMLAVQRHAHTLTRWQQRLRQLEQVRHLRLEDRVHSPPRSSGKFDGSLRPHLCDQGVGDDCTGDPKGQSAHFRDGGEGLLLHRAGGQVEGHEGQSACHGSRSHGSEGDPPDDVQRQAIDLEGHGSREDPIPPDTTGAGSHSRSGIATPVAVLSGGDGGSVLGISGRLGSGGGGDQSNDQSGHRDPIDELGTTVPELQTESDTKKVRFSEALGADAEFKPVLSSSPSSKEAAWTSLADEPEETYDTADFELLKYVETKCMKPHGGRKKKSSKKNSQHQTHSSLPQSSDLLEAVDRPPSHGLPVLPWKVCQAVMALCSMLLLTAHQNLQGLLRDDRQVDVWEMFCAPDSWLSTACDSEGLRFSRVNLHQHYDLYQPETYERLWPKFLRERPKRIWVSARCTYWCPFTSLNYKTVESRAQLDKYRRKERSMFKKLIPFLARVVQYDPSVEVFWEWPTRCYGWSEPGLHQLEQEMLNADKEWLYSRIDGCRYGLLSKQGLPLRKQWTIATSSRHFYDLYKNKTCTGAHEHDYIQGVETNRSAYYPWKMCKSIAQTWRAELYPEKWLDRLHAPVAQHLTMDEQLDLLELEIMPQEIEDEPNEEERKRWNLQLLRYHRAAGHPNNYNLARILREAGQPRWKVDAAFQLQCDDCRSLKMGGISSGKIPPASLRPMPAAWEVVGMDVTEWTPPNSRQKYKLLVLMDSLQGCHYLADH